MFDMAANGGGLLTLRYEKERYLPVQRTVQAPWRDYAWLPDVVMIAYDDKLPRSSSRDQPMCRLRAAAQSQMNVAAVKPRSSSRRAHKP